MNEETLNAILEELETVTEFDITNLATKYEFDGTDLDTIAIIAEKWINTHGFPNIHVVRDEEEPDGLTFAVDFGYEEELMNLWLQFNPDDPEPVIFKLPPEEEEPDDGDDQ